VLKSEETLTELVVRARHDVAVQLKTYVRCIGGQADVASQRTTDASRHPTPSPA